MVLTCYPEEYERQRHIHELHMAEAEASEQPQSGALKADQRELCLD